MNELKSGIYEPREQIALLNTLSSLSPKRIAKVAPHRKAQKMDPAERVLKTSVASGAPNRPLNTHVCTSAEISAGTTHARTPRLDSELAGTGAIVSARHIYPPRFVAERRWGRGSRVLYFLQACCWMGRTVLAVLHLFFFCLNVVFVWFRLLS